MVGRARFRFGQRSKVGFPCFIFLAQQTKTKGPPSAIAAALKILGYLEDGDMEWLASIETSVGFFGRLLGKSDLREREELAKGLEKALRTDQRFQKIRWHEGEQGMSPSSDFPDRD